MDHNTITVDRAALINRAGHRNSEAGNDRGAQKDEFSVSIDELSQSAWEQSLAEFADASIYQTWAYGAARSGEGTVSRLILKKGGLVVAMAQVRIASLPLLTGGVAYVSRGPVWQRKGELADPGIQRTVLCALLDEYAKRRRLFLKVTPNTLAYEGDASAGVLEALGFKKNPSRSRTIVLDLRPSLDELRGGLRKSWRRGLDKAEKSDLEIIEGNSQENFLAALEVHHRMHDRKQYAEFVVMEEFAEVQKNLPDSLRLHILLCRYEGTIVSVLGWSVFGDVGFPIINATDGAGLKLGASNLLWWRMVSWMKERGFRTCDLAGINPERNPGGYTFKTGMCKTHGLETSLSGEFTYCESAVSGLVYKTGTWAKQSVASLRLAVERYRQRKSAKASPPTPTE